MPDPLLGSVSGRTDFDRVERGVYFRNAGVHVYDEIISPDKLKGSFDFASDGFTSDTILQSASGVVQDNHGGTQLHPGFVGGGGASNDSRQEQTVDNPTILRVVQDLRKLEHDNFRTFATKFLSGDFEGARVMHEYLFGILNAGNANINEQNVFVPNIE